MKWLDRVSPSSYSRAGLVKRFVHYFFFINWYSLSLGFHICLNPCNVEIHLPFGFIRIGYAWEIPTDEQ